MYLDTRSINISFVAWAAALTVHRTAGPQPHSAVSCCAARNRLRQSPTTRYLAPLGPACPPHRARRKYFAAKPQSASIAAQSNGSDYLLRFVPVLREVRHVCLDLTIKRPATGQPRIRLLARNVFTLEPEVGVDGQKQGVEESKTMNCQSSETRTRWGTYCLFSGISFHVGGKFFPGCGHAGQSRAHSPGFVPAGPSAACPRPKRLSISRLPHCLVMRRNSWYRSCVGDEDGKNMKREEPTLAGRSPVLSVPRARAW